MNKLYLLLLSTAICLLTSFRASAQTYTEGNLTVVKTLSMSHDSGTCISRCRIDYDVTVDTSFLGDSVIIVDTFAYYPLATYRDTLGVTPWTFHYTSYIYLDDYELHSDSAHFGHRTLKFIGTADTVRYVNEDHVLYVTDPCTYNFANGKAYIDNNSDCIYNTGDVALNHIRINGKTNLTGLVRSRETYSYTNLIGDYALMLQESWMTSYTISLPPIYYFIFPPSTCFSGDYTLTTLPALSADFPLQCSGSVDVRSAACTPPAVRVDQPFFIRPTVYNIGCDSVSGQMRLIKDSRVTYDSALSANPAMYVSGDTLIWDYVNLTNLTGGAYWNSIIAHVHLTPDTSVHAGDLLCFTVLSDIPSTDLDTTNNSFTFCLPVVYSYDPNIKVVAPQGIGDSGLIDPATRSLSYTLHFQNTGTDYAYNISIIDTLDPDVDPTSLRIENVSHRMEPEWLAPGIVRFNFPSIFLPDSARNEAASHGSVRFTIALRTGLPAGRQIMNTGYIYFDRNPPVITNTALNTIADTSSIHIPDTTVITLGMATDGSTGPSVYPNPAHQQITIENLQHGRIQIMNITGAVVINQEITKNRTTIDLSKLPNGVYILKTISPYGITTRKLIKE